MNKKEEEEVWNGYTTMDKTFWTSMTRTFDVRPLTTLLVQV